MQTNTIKNKSLKIIAVFLLVMIFHFSNAQNVSLKGTLQHFAGIVTLQDMSDVGAIAPEKDEYTFTVQKDGRFALQINIAQPNYFRIGRNILYLSPGDDLELYADYENPETAVFYGKGAAANMYLRFTAFPKAGSYAGLLDYKKLTPQNALIEIKTATDKRKKELQKLTGVSALFRQLEAARIEADLVNSIKKIPTYYQYYVKPREGDPFIKDFEKISKADLNRSLNRLKNAENMQLAVFRDVANDVISNNKGIMPKDAQQIQDWQVSSQLYYEILRESNKDSLKTFSAAINAVKTLKYKKALQELVAYASMYGKGDKVIDFVVRDTAGNNIPLSSLKGKIIYLDFWATWCVPCMEEMPYFEKLKEKYKDNSGIAIVSVSIDDNINAWIKNLDQRKAEGYQWQINREKIKDYRINEVPRAIIIDKNFTIAEMRAPMPSDESLPSLLNKLLKK